MNTLTQLPRAELAAKLLAGLVPSGWFACASCDNRWEAVAASPCPACGLGRTEIMRLPDAFGHDLERLLRAIAEGSGNMTLNEVTEPQRRILRLMLSNNLVYSSGDTYFVGNVKVSRRMKKRLRSERLIEIAATPLSRKTTYRLTALGRKAAGEGK